jgi:hypothetical protein
MQRDMVDNAMRQLATLAEDLQSNIDLYIATNGGEEAVNEAIAEGRDTRLPLARFKLELVHTTRLRFETILSASTKAVQDFVKVAPTE